MSVALKSAWAVKSPVKKYMKILFPFPAKIRDIAAVIFSLARLS